jgi:hypothetical protein
VADGSARCRADDGSFLIFNDLEGPPGIRASLSVALPRAAVMIGSRNAAIRTTTSLSCAGAELNPLFPKKPCHCVCFARIAASLQVEEIRGLVCAGAQRFARTACGSRQPEAVISARDMHRKERVIRGLASTRAYRSRAARSSAIDLPSKVSMMSRVTAPKWRSPRPV